MELSIGILNNDEAVNKLIEKGYICTINIEKVFRCIDLGFYYNAQLHPFDLCYPSIYASALECLKLHTGLRFLNIGSGMGFFSTMAGLLLGVNGINHGIEIDQHSIDYAYRKLEVAKSEVAAIDHYDFCEPIFIKGNIFELSPTSYYDRVFCGANISFEHIGFMTSLINIGGILVIPVEGHLVKITRLEENSYIIQAKCLSLSEIIINTDLVIPETRGFNTVNFPPVEPPSLQELCRSNIRSFLRNKIIKEIPSLTTGSKCKLEFIEDEIYFIRDESEDEFSEESDLDTEIVPSTINIIDSTSSQSDNDSWETMSESSESTETENYGRDLDTQSEDGIYFLMTESVDVFSEESDLDTESVPSTIIDSTSPHSDSDSWETMSESFEFPETQSVANDSEMNQAERTIPYQFIKDRQENVLSQLLKIKINELPLPTLLKTYLNYN